MLTKGFPERPAKVADAVRLLYLVVVIGVVRAAMTVIRHADVRSPDFLIFTKLVVYAASLFLIYEMGKGKNWARWMLVVIFAISIPLIILPNFEAIFHNPIHAILGVGQLGLYLVALLFLFHGSSAEWFGSRRTSTEQ